MGEKKLTGYPSIDKPWLKYYSEINAPLPHMTAYEYLKQQNVGRLDYLAIDSEVGNYTYREPFAQIDATAAALWAMGIQKRQAGSFHVPRSAPRELSVLWH